MRSANTNQPSSATCVVVPGDLKLSVKHLHFTFPELPVEGSAKSNSKSKVS